MENREINTRLGTPQGEIALWVDGAETVCDWQPLPLEDKGFRVDLRTLGRVKVASAGRHHVRCGFAEKPQGLLDWGPETGERLALVSWQFINGRLCLATVGDVPGREYRYTETGLEVELEVIPGETLYFCMAAKALRPGEDGIEPWLAADVDSLLREGEPYV